MWPFVKRCSAFLTARLCSAMNLGGLSVRETAVRTWARINEHEILTRAAAISFYAIAALVPFLALVITLGAYLLPWATLGGVSADAMESAGPANPLRDLLPEDAASVVARELKRLQEEPHTGLVSFGLIATLWLSSSLFLAIMDAMNRIMGVTDSRPWWRQRLVAVVMALIEAAILIGVFVTTLIWPQILRWLNLGEAAAALATVVQLVIVFV